MAPPMEEQEGEAAEPSESGACFLLFLHLASKTKKGRLYFNYLRLAPRRTTTSTTSWSGSVLEDGQKKEGRKWWGRKGGKALWKVVGEKRERKAESGEAEKALQVVVGSF